VVHCRFIGTILHTGSFLSQAHDSIVPGLHQQEKKEVSFPSSSTRFLSKKAVLSSLLCGKIGSVKVNLPTLVWEKFATWLLLFSYQKRHTARKKVLLVSKDFCRQERILSHFWSKNVFPFWSEKRDLAML